MLRGGSFGCSLRCDRGDSTDFKWRKRGVVSLPIAVAIILLLAMVVLLDGIRAIPRAVLHRCPRKLGCLSGLVAGGSLMIDYILTVTVSISAGTAATSAIPVQSLVDFARDFFFLVGKSKGYGNQASCL